LSAGTALAVALGDDADAARRRAERMSEAGYFRASAMKSSREMRRTAGAAGLSSAPVRANMTAEKTTNGVSRRRGEPINVVG
jgi:hypothetical protein